MKNVLFYYIYLGLCEKHPGDMLIHLETEHLRDRKKSIITLQSAKLRNAILACVVSCDGKMSQFWERQCSLLGSHLLGDCSEL